jgi:C1A family cysteine protease
MYMKVLKITSPIGLFLALIVLAMAPLGAAYASGGTSGDNSAAGPVTVQWSVDAQITVYDSEAAELGLRAATSSTVDALVSKLTARGIKAEKRAAGADEKGMVYAVKASGSGDVESFRSLMYNDAAPQFHLLGGVTEMEILAPVQGSGKGGETVLVLESNLSTGAHWHVAAGSGMVESQPATFEKHTIGYGVTERQTLRLTPTGAGGPIRLVYKRGWEETAPTQHVKVTLSALPASLNLSDPAGPLGPHQGVTGAVHNEVFPAAPLTGLPAHFDWRDQDVVTPVRDQNLNACGSCWAFGTVGIVESALRISGVVDVDLSEQFLISCNTDGWGCNGGLTAHKYHYDTMGLNQGTIGAVLETTKPYTGTPGSCPSNYDKPYQLTGWAFVTPTQFTMPTVAQVKNAIYAYGPVTAAVCAGRGWDAYPTAGDIFTTDETTSCCGYLAEPCTNHQIILVGWDDPGGYWILKNSWGTGWGVGGSGYMYIKYGISRVGEGPSWVTVSAQATHALTLSRTGSGRTVSSPAGINCGATCAKSFTHGAAVTLTATPAANFAFTGWSGGGCSGTGKCTVTMSSDVSVSAIFTPLPCTYALSLANKAFPYAGGSVNLTVAAKGVQCAAPGMASDPWISPTLVGSFKNNTGTVKVTATANDTINGRKGTATIGGKILNVAEAGIPCSIILSPASVNPTSAGGSGSFSVTSPTGCGWTAVVGLGPKWLSISSGTSGSGNGAIVYNVKQNTTGLARLGRIRVNSTKNPIAVYKRFRVTQQK